MAIKGTLYNLGNGRARIRDAAGQELQIDGQPVEVDIPASGAAAGGPAPADARKAAGLDRDSLRATMLLTSEGRDLLAKLDAGQLSWDVLVEPVVAEQLARA